jgi:hypothetical protein
MNLTPAQLAWLVKHPDTPRSANPDRTRFGGVGTLHADGVFEPTLKPSAHASPMFQELHDHFYAP